MRVMIGAAYATALAVAAGAAEPPRRASDAGLPLTCGDPVGWDATEADLVAKFGKENVVFGDLGGPEGEEMPGTRVNGGDTARRLEIVWEDEAARARPSFIRVFSGWDEATGREVIPVWIAPGGLKAGQTVAEVEALNGKPFRLSGFGWDYGGMVQSWEDGALATAQPRCDLEVFFNPRADFAESVTGDTTVSSDDPALRASDPVVMMFTITYRRDEE
ncbi:MAG: hypothetical protein QM698_05280 [Micropepsaceae bacterium]